MFVCVTCLLHAACAVALHIIILSLLLLLLLFLLIIILVTCRHFAWDVIQYVWHDTCLVR